MLKFIYHFFFFPLEVIIIESLPCIFPDPHAGSNYLQPLLGPLSNMLQMLQECSQLELALRVLLNSYGSCLQHITSNVMDLKLSVQVWRQHIQWCYQYHFLVSLCLCHKTFGNMSNVYYSFSCMMPKSFKSTRYG